jgi:hypothetical protein
MTVLEITEVPEHKFAQTSIASEIPGSVDISPPTILRVKSIFFCSQKPKKKGGIKCKGVTCLYSSIENM